MKKQSIRILGISAIMAMSSIYLSAQSIHEFSVYGGGGLSTLHYKLAEGDRSGGIGGDFGVGYTFINANWQASETGTLVSAQWGLHTGIGLGLYNAKSNLNGVKTVTSDLTDNDIVATQFHLHTTLREYNETQNALYLNIPVMGLYQTTLGRQLFYGMGGVKFGIPISSNFKSKNATFVNKAYYWELDNWAETQEFAGYGTFKGRNSDGDVELGFNMMLALEGGVKWRISENLFIYTGLFFDYGLNNVSKGNYQKFVNYNKDNPKGFTTNSVLASYSNSNPKELKMFTEKINLMAVGIKVRVTLGK